MRADIALGAAVRLPAPAVAVVLLILAGILVWVTVSGTDRWPFSHYPMFGVATEANAVRFFCLRVHYEAGLPAALPPAANVLADRFHREFERVWARGAVASAEAEKVLLRVWREAITLDARLAAVRKVEVIMRIGRLVGGRVIVMEKPVYTLRFDDVPPGNERC